MVGITLSPEQIRAAPPEVRHWLEHQIAALLGLRTPPIESPEHLVACTPQEAMAVYQAIRAMPPVMNVFFELGRKGESVGDDGLQALRLNDMLGHSRLPDMQQLAACLNVIDQAFGEVRNDRTATLYAIDPKGYCVIDGATQRSIVDVWNHIVAAQEPHGIEQPDGSQPHDGGSGILPFSHMSGTVPPSAIHLGGLVSPDR
jgi:hypothetical protein